MGESTVQDGERGHAASDRARSFQALRPLLFAIAYRMLGSAAEAEDVLQDAWLRWEATPLDDVESEKSWLSTVVTRLCLDTLKSARRQREEYLGPWLPEPIRTEERSDPDSISMAFLVLLERLSPIERASYLLHEVFDYSHGEVAAILGKEEATCRQVFHRAEARIRQGRPRFAPSRARHEQLLRTFAEAIPPGPDQTFEVREVNGVARARRSPPRGGEPGAHDRDGRGADSDGEERRQSGEASPPLSGRGGSRRLRGAARERATRSRASS